MQTTTPAELSPEKREKIINFLKTHPVGVLATVDAKGDPHASTIYFAVDNDLGITFTTKQDTIKYGNIAHHNKVMLVAYEAANQMAVQISGRAVEATEPEEQQAIYHGTLKASKQTSEDVVPPIAKLPAGPYVGFTIHIDNIWLSEYGWGDNFAHAMKHAYGSGGSGDPA